MSLVRKNSWWRSLFARTAPVKKVTSLKYLPSFMGLEERITPAFNVSLSLDSTVGMTMMTAAGTTTFTANATGANLSFADIGTELLAGKNVVVDTGSTGTEAGNITSLITNITINTSPGVSLTFQSGSGAGLVGDISLPRIGLFNAPANSASIFVRANHHVVINEFMGNGLNVESIDLRAATGSITTPGTLVGANLALSAATGIGTSGSPLLTQVANLEARTSTGGIFINNTGNLTIGGVSGALSGVNVTASGDISVVGTGNLTVNENVSTAAGTITLQTGGSSTFVNNAAISNAGANLIRVRSDVQLLNPGSSISASNSGEINLRANTVGVNVELGTIGNATGLNLSQAELDTITAGTLKLTASSNILLTAPVTLTNTPSLVLEATLGSLVDNTAGEQADLTATNLAVKTASGIGNANDIDINVTKLAFTNSTSGLVQLSDVTGGLTIDSVAEVTSSSSADGGTLATAGLLTIATNLVMKGDLTLAAGVGVAGSGDLITGTAATTTLTIDQSGDSTYSGRIGGPSGGNANDKKINFIKEGAGTQKLSGSNTYTGTTTVADGTLVVNGVSGSGATTVQSGATIGGTGTVGASGTDLTIQNGGTLSPGDGGVGTLTVGDFLVLNTGSTFLVDIGPNATSDQVAVVGSTISQGAKLLGTANSPLSASPYVLITHVNTIGGTGFVDVNGTNLPPFSGGPIVVGGKQFSYRYQTSGFSLQTVGTTVFVDGSGNLNINDTLNKNDTLSISRNGANIRVSDPNNSLVAGAGAIQVDPHTVDVPFASVTGKVLINSGNGSDTVILNLANGIIPPGGLSYVGGTGPDSVIVNGTGGDDKLIYRAVAASPGDTEFSFNDGPFDATMSGIDHFSFNGLDGNDRMTVDYVNGDPVAGGGVDFNGGANDDLLVVTSPLAAGRTGNYLPNDEAFGSGVVNVEGGQIRFTSLAPVDVTGFASFTLVLPNSDDTVDIIGGVAFGDPMQPALIVSGDSNGTPFETLAVWNVTNLTIDTTTLDGTDAISLGTTGPALDTMGMPPVLGHHVTNLILNTGTSVDTVNVTGTVELGGSLTFNLGTGANVLTFTTATVTAPTGISQTGEGSIILAGTITSLNTMAGDINLIIDINGSTDKMQSLLMNTTSGNVIVENIGEKLLELDTLAMTTVTGNFQLNGTNYSAGTQTYDGPVILGTNATFTSMTANKSVAFKKTATSIPACNDLTINIGTSDLLFSDAVTDIGNLLIQSARDITVDGTMSVSTFVQQAGTGTTRFNGTTTINRACPFSDVFELDIKTNAIVLDAAVTVSDGVAFFETRFNPQVGGVSQLSEALQTSQLRLEGIGTFDLNQAGNDITTALSANIDGSLTLRDVNDLEIKPTAEPQIPAGVITSNDNVLLTSGLNFTANNNSVTLIDLGTGTFQAIPGISGNSLVIFNTEIIASSAALGSSTFGSDNTNNDAFRVRPSSNVSITVYGNLPQSAVLPPGGGDTILPLLDTPQNINLTTTPIPGTTSFDGTYKFTMGQKDINFFNIEGLEDLSIQAVVYQTTFGRFNIILSLDQGTGPINAGATVAPVENAFVISPRRVNPVAPYSAPKVAIADFDGNTFPDLIIANGSNTAGVVTVIKGEALIGITSNPDAPITKSQILTQFYAFEPTFVGGLFVTTGNVIGDNKPEIIIGSDAGRRSAIRIFSFNSTTASKLQNFKLTAPYLPAPIPPAPSRPYIEFTSLNTQLSGFGTSGVRVAAGKVTGGAYDDIVVGTGSGVTNKVNVIRGDTFSLVRSFRPYSLAFKGGVQVAAGDFNGDGYADVLTGPGAGKSQPNPRLFVFSGIQLTAGTPPPPPAAPNTSIWYLFNEDAKFDISPTGVQRLGWINYQGVSSVAFVRTSTGQISIVVGSPRGLGTQLKQYTGANLPGEPLDYFTDLVFSTGLRKNFRDGISIANFV